VLEVKSIYELVNENVETFVNWTLPTLEAVIVVPLFVKLSDPANCVPLALAYWMVYGLPDGVPPLVGAVTPITVPLVDENMA
jgi:hypothetical protein